MRPAYRPPFARSSAVRPTRRLQPGWARLIRAVHGRWMTYAASFAALCRRGMTEKAVHDYRVASRRLVAALRLCSHAIPGSAPDKLRRRVGRRFDGFRRLRDVQVMLRRLAPAATEAPRKAAVIGRLRRRLAKESAGLQRDLLRKLPEDLPAMEHAHMRAILGGLSSAARAPARTHVAVLLHERLAAAQRRAIRRSARISADDLAALHRLRIAIKRARYLLELVAAVQDVPRAIAAIRQARGWQDVLGECQDLRVLDAEVAAMRPKTASDRAALMRLRERIAAERDERIRAVLRQHAALEEFLRQIHPASQAGLGARRKLRTTSKPP